MLVDFISCNSSWVTPKHAKVWSLSKKVVFHFFFPLLADCYIILFVRCVYNVYIYILMYSWMGINLVLCFRGVWNALPLVPLRFITALYGGNHFGPHAHWSPSQFMLVGWLHFLRLGRTETRLKLGLWLLVMFPLFRCCVFGFLFRPMRFWMVSEQCGGNFKATTRFYWVRSEGVDRFVVDWCWVGGFAGFSSFPETWLRLPCPRLTC